MSRRPRADGLTYEPVGGSLAPDLLRRPPRGYRAREDRATIGVGGDVFERASSALLRWRLQERVGIRVRRPGSTGADEPLRPGEDVVLAIRAYGVVTHAPARVVAVVDEADRVGFAYGTRSGHPESGEVAFVLERRPDRGVDLVVRSFSRPATVVWRLLWPFVQWKSRRTTRAYLTALRGHAPHGR